MYKILIVCVMLLSHPLTQAQNAIYGTVTDNHYAPLVGATVYVPDMHKGCVTDKNGAYQLTGLPNGKIKIQFSFVGYTNHIETIILNQTTKEINVEIAQTAIEAEELVVSGGYNSTQHENAVKIDILKLTTSTQKVTPNFMEMLTKIPGVDMISKGNGVSKPVIRGLSMNDILVLNNGVRFENYQYSSHHPLGIDEFGVQDVEVIKGPASLLYGSDAIGGVLNFIKENPAPVGSMVGDYNLQLFSNSQGMTNNLGVKGSTGKFFAGFRAGQKTHADYLQGGGNFVPNSRFNETSVKTNAGFTGKNGTFKLYYDYNNQLLGLVEDEAVEKILNRGRKNEVWYQQFNTHLLSSQNKLYVGQYKIDVNTAYQSTDLMHVADVNEYELEMRLATLTYEAKVYFPSDANSEYIAGIQGYNQENTNLNSRETVLLPDASTRTYSAFGLLQRSFFEKLKVQAGLRYDIKSIQSQSVGLPTDASAFRPAIGKYFDSFSGAVGATFHFSDQLLIRGNFASAYRTPNLGELTSNGPHELRFEIGDNQLIPENSYETDMSLHYHHSNVTFDVAGFYNVVDHYIFIAPTGEVSNTNIDIYRYKQANAYLYGGEAGIHIHPEVLKWMHFETTYSTVVGQQTSGDFLPFIPAQKLQLEMRAEKEKLLFFKQAFCSLNVTKAFDQNRAAPDEAATNGYVLVDVSVGGNWIINKQSILLSLSANNLFDIKYIDHLSTLKEVGLYNPGRNVALSVKVPF